MNIDTLQRPTDAQGAMNPAQPFLAGWFAQMVANWQAGLAAQRAAAFGVDDELRDLGPSRHAIEREIRKPVWHG
jgi:hypothetical protein